MLAQSNTTFEFYASRRNQRVDLFLLINLNESTTISLAQNTTAIIALGFLGQALFGARLIVQIFLSEKHRRVVSPVVFWQLSLAGSLLFLIYGIVRNDWVIISGQFLSYFIYVRNLQLKGAWHRFPVFIRGCLLLTPVVAVSSLFYLPATHGGEVFLWHPMILIGTIGQLALNLRFVYQWYYSEKHKTSILPVGFWHISVWASVLVIVYSLFHPVLEFEPVLLVSQSMGIVVYIRNLFIYKTQTTQPSV